MSKQKWVNRSRVAIRLSLSSAAFWALWPVSPSHAQQPLIISRMQREPRAAIRVASQIQERRTHRGWEVHAEQFIVLANSSQEDARLAAERFQTALADSRRQLELLTGPLPRGNRARGAVQITIDKTPWKGSGAPPFMRRAGYAESVYLYVGPEQPPLAQQIDQLNQVAAVLVVDTYLSSPAVPETLRVGLASFVAPRGDLALADSDRTGEARGSLLPTDGGRAAATTYQKLRADSVARGKHPWTREDHEQRAGAERDQGVEMDEVDQARQLVEFLLTGYDGRFAAAFGQALRAAVLQQETELETHRQRPRTAIPFAGAAPAAVAGQNAGQLSRQAPSQVLGLNPVQLAAANGPANEAALSPLIQLVEALQAQFETWKQDPSVGLPRWEPLEKDNPQLTEHQRELLFVARLLQRGLATGARPVEPRVIELSANGGVTQGKPAPGRPIDLAEWVRVTGMSDQRWAIVDANGQLVWNHDTEPLQQRLALNSKRYSAVWRDGRVVVRENIGKGQTLEAWIEPNPADQLASTARFAVRLEN